MSSDSDVAIKPEPLVPTLVYWGVMDNEVRFVPARHAHELATLYRALATAKTWGEFKQMVSAEVYEQALAVAAWEDDDEDDEDDNLIGEDSAFSPETLVENFPNCAAIDMANWLPEEIIERFGCRCESVVSGELLAFAAEDAPAIIAALKNMGFKCRKNQRLVERAEGYD